MIQYLLTPSGELERARSCGLPLVHLAFSLGQDGLLHHDRLPDACRGGLMLTGAAEAPENGPPDRAVRAILALCRDRGFRGVVLDWEGPPTPYLSRLIRELDRGLARAERGFFLPEPCARLSRRAFLYFSSAISGGSLAQRLREAAAEHGAARLVLALERTAEEFPIPAPGGAGRQLYHAELEDLLRRLRPAVRFSEDLCAHYFTCMDRKGRPRLILFDRADSLRKKRELARAAGIERFFLLYPQVEDLLPDLID